MKLKVLVVQTWGVGDMIMALPMIRRIRAALPDALVTVLAGSRSAAFSLDREMCDEIKYFAGRRRWWEVATLVSWIRECSFDIAFVATGIHRFTGAVLKYGGGIPIVVGGGASKTPLGFTHWKHVVKPRHRVDTNIEIVSALFPALSAPSELGTLRLSPKVVARADALRLTMELTGKAIFAIHPGSDVGPGVVKRPPVELCRELAVRIARRDNTAVVIILGPVELHLRPEFDGLGDQVKVLANEELAVIAAFLRLTQAVICGDSGIGHVAAAVGTRVITMAGPTDVCNTRPYGERHSVVRAAPAPTCMPCYGTPLYFACPYEQLCMKSIHASDVLRRL